MAMKVGDNMNIIVEDKLKRHMKEEKLDTIIVGIEKCFACGGGYNSVIARFKEDGEELDPSKYEVYKTETCEIYLPKEGVEYGDTLRFVWQSYYWLDGLGVAGAKALS